MDSICLVTNPFGFLVKINQTIPPSIENIMKRIHIFCLNPDGVMKMGPH